MASFTLQQLEDAAQIVYQSFAPTPQQEWPLLSNEFGARVYVKHENHTPLGAFKVRGGLVYGHHLKQSGEVVKGLIGATRGNHGQSVAFAAAKMGLPATIVVPFGNSACKNKAMKALGAELIEYGQDFMAAIAHAKELATERQYHMIPSFHPWLVEGVASYALEFFRATPKLDTVYVPIGLGSGICGVIAARDALGLDTQVVGVVAQGANAYYQSFEAKRIIATETVNTMADGVACSTPHPDAFEMILKGADRVVAVSEHDIQQAIELYFTHTHNIAEGAGAVPLAALIQEHRSHPERVTGKNMGVILSGGNIDPEPFVQCLTGSQQSALV